MSVAIGRRRRRSVPDGNGAREPVVERGPGAALDAALAAFAGVMEEEDLG